MSVRSTSLLRTAVKGVRGLHSSALRQAASPFRFPAMSPTMTEGGIAEWKIKEGEAFSAGDVLLEIETDKATIDVETQDDGILGKIIKQDGAKGIQVGELIGILVEEGDDTASLSADQFSTQEGGDAPAASSSSPEQPAEKPSSSSSAPPKESEPAPAPSSSPASGSHGAGHAQYTHAKPLAPSVSRLLSTSSLDPQVVAKLKGSGRAGYLTKGDVLKAMGKIPTVWGSKESEALELAGKRGVMERFAIPGGSKPAAGAPKAAPAPPQDAPSLRRAVLAGLVASSTARSSAAVVPALTKASFDDVLADYLPKRSSAPLVTEAFGLAKPKQTGFEGLF